MRIGLIAQLHGRPGGQIEPSWQSVSDLAKAAEDSGFDMFVFEDVLMYRGENHTDGCWESMVVAGAIAATTTSIDFGQSVVNSPYRQPTLLASQATTLDEISGGRYVLGIGAGNSDDYEEFGFPPDHRFSRFEEAIEIIHKLLKSGRIRFSGEFYEVGDAELVLRGPNKRGPTINIAASGPKMMRLVAHYGDAWNWWSFDEALSDLPKSLGPVIARLEKACEEVGRDPGEVERTLDVYSVTPPGFEPPDGRQPVSGTASEISEYLASLQALGFSEVRCDLTDKSTAAVAAMGEVVELVHEL